jgi:hypothetical protein
MPRFIDWMQQLEAKHLANLQFAEVSRALRALSSTYVERRSRLADGAPLKGEGKRAAFALFYGPLHYLLVREIVSSIPNATAIRSPLVDLGCGTGAASAAWAAACERPPSIVAVDTSPWALQEAIATYRAFGLNAKTRRSDLETFRLPQSPASILAAFAVNELAEQARGLLLKRLMDRAAGGDAILIVEPIANSVVPWWRSWRERFELAGGRADEWRVRVELPAIVAKLDRAAGLKHQELSGRSLWIAPQPNRADARAATH